jgi:hypothetical protein
MSELRNRHALEKSITEIETDDREQSEELETLDVVPPLSPKKATIVRRPSLGMNYTAYLSSI